MPHKVQNKPALPRVLKKAITPLTKTPLEHTEQYRSPTIYEPKRNTWGAFLVMGLEGKLPEYALPAPPPGHIRVKWFSQFEGLDCSSGELEANLPLEPNGDLNLIRVQNLWGMDKCVPINPWRMKRFEPKCPDVITALAIHCLKDNQGAIRLLEEPSERVLRIRGMRRRVITFFQNCQDSWYGIAFVLFLCLFSILWWITSFLQHPRTYHVWLGFPIK